MTTFTLQTEQKVTILATLGNTAKAVTTDSCRLGFMTRQSQMSDLTLLIQRNHFILNEDNASYGKLHDYDVHMLYSGGRRVLAMYTVKGNNYNYFTLTGLVESGTN